MSATGYRNYKRVHARAHLPTAQQRHTCILDTALTHNMGDKRYAHCPAQGPHTCTAPQAGGSSLVCTPPWLEVLPRGRHPEDTPATALVLWCRCITRGRATATLPALGEEADEPEADEPREVAFKQLGVFRARGRVVAQSEEQSRVQVCRETQTSKYGLATCRQRRWSKEREPRRKISERHVEGEQMILESRGSRQEVQVPVSDRENRSGSSNTHQYRAECRFHCRQLRWRKEGERRREPGGKDVEEKHEIQESRVSRQEVQFQASDREYRSYRSSTHQLCAEDRVMWRQQWRLVGDACAGDQCEVCVEEMKEIAECREVSGGSQSLSRVRPVKTDTNNPPSQHYGKGDE